MTYRHIQSSRWTWSISAAGLVGLIWVVVSPAATSGATVLATASFVLLIATGAVISRLTSTVDGHTVSAAFGWGWPRRTIALEEIVGVRKLRNSWWHGWGIRKVSRGWMYNIAGYDAVELELRGSRVFRIGTDEPDALLDAIDRARGQID
jgi:hypothetical protein